VKIILAIATLVAVVGAVIVIIAQATASDAVEINWEASQARTATLTVSATGENHCGFGIYLPAEAACDDAVAGLGVSGPTPEINGQQWRSEVQKLCDPNSASVELTDGSAVKLSAHVDVEAYDQGQKKPVAGTYTITSSVVDMWVMDYCEVLGEVVTGLFAALGLMVFALVLFLISSILCCVSCCCCGPEPGKQQAGAGGVVIGQAVQASG